MSNIRLYIDEDAMSDAVVVGLRARGVDVETVAEAGLVRRSDAEQLTWATASGRVVYTFNGGDFLALHTAYLQAGRSHRGIVIGQQQPFRLGQQIRCLTNLIAARSAEDMVDSVEFLSDWRES